MTTSSSVLIAVVCILAIVLITLTVVLVKNRKAQVEDDVEYVNNQIYVGNLPYRVNEDDLRNYFSRYGAIQSVRVIRNFKTGRSRGYAFINFADSNEANSALIVHGKDMQGRSMVVRIAKPRQDQA